MSGNARRKKRDEKWQTKRCFRESRKFGFVASQVKLRFSTGFVGGIWGVGV